MHWTDIHTRHRGPVTVIELRGHLTLGDDDRRLMPEVSRWLDAGHRVFLLNLQHLSLIDSTGVGEMVGVYTRVTNLGGNVSSATSRRGSRKSSNRPASTKCSSPLAPKTRPSRG